MLSITTNAYLDRKRLLLQCITKDATLRVAQRVHDGPSVAIVSSR